MKSVSANLAQGQMQLQMQLTMKETEERKDRDERAIRWLIENMTEDAEMETFLLAIPGSFNSVWGTEVWKRVSKHQESGDQSQDEAPAIPHRDTTTQQPSSSWSLRSVLRPIVHLVRKPTPPHSPTHATTPSSVPHPPNVQSHSTASTTEHIQEENVMHELSTRASRSVEICKNRKLFLNHHSWQKRTRGCIESIACLVCCANARLAWFGDVSELLGETGKIEEIRKLSSGGTDQLFVMRWTCLSLAAIRPILEDDRVRNRVEQAVGQFTSAPISAQKINEMLQEAKRCLEQLYEELHKTEDLTEEVKRILRHHESEISQLEQINTEAKRLESVDSEIFNTQNIINVKSHLITSQIPGVLDDFEHYYHAPIPFGRFVELSSDPRKLQFIRPGQILRSICSPSLILRNTLKGQGDANAYKELLKNLKEFRFSSWRDDVMQPQFWRLQDLHDGGGLGFTVELFFLALSQLSSTSSSRISHSALYTGTFQVITSDWSKHKHSLGTQKLLLHIATSRRWDFEKSYPAYIVDEFLLLLRNIFEGQTGSHVDEARRQFQSSGSGGFRERVLKALS